MIITYGITPPPKKQTLANKQVYRQNGFDIDALVYKQHSHASQVRFKLPLNTYEL